MIKFLLNYRKNIVKMFSLTHSVYCILASKIKNKSIPIYYIRLSIILPSLGN